MAIALPRLPLPDVPSAVLGDLHLHADVHVGIPEGKGPAGAGPSVVVLHSIRFGLEPA
jgi:hypothetical protein